MRRRGQPLAPSPTLAEMRREMRGVRVWCLDCGHYRVLAIDDLIALRGPGYRFHTLARKLRCSRCESKRFDIWPGTFETDRRSSKSSPRGTGRP